MEIKTTSILIDDSGNPVKEGDAFSLLVGKRSVIGEFAGIRSAGMIAFRNPISGEKFNIRLSSIVEAKRCSFKLEA